MLLRNEKNFFYKINKTLLQTQNTQKMTATTLIELPQLVIVKILKKLLYERQCFYNYARNQDTPLSKQNFLSLLLTNTRFYNVYRSCTNRILKHCLQMGKLFTPKPYPKGYLLDMREMPKKAFYGELEADETCSFWRSTSKNIMIFKIKKIYDVVRNIILKPNKDECCNIEEIHFCVGGLSMHVWKNVGVLRKPRSFQIDLLVTNLTYAAIAIKIHFKKLPKLEFLVSVDTVFLRGRFRQLIINYATLSKYVYSAGGCGHPIADFYKNFKNFEKLTQIPDLFSKSCQCFILCSLADFQRSNIK